MKIYTNSIQYVSNMYQINKYFSILLYFGLFRLFINIDFLYYLKYFYNYELDNT